MLEIILNSINIPYKIYFKGMSDMQTNPNQENYFFRPKLSQRDIAGILQVDTKTLYNWKRRKPNLYRIIMLGFKFEEMLRLSKKHYEELLEIESKIFS